MSDKLGAQNSKPETPRPARLTDHQHATRLLALRTWLEKMQRTYLADTRRPAADAARAARTCAEWAESVAYVHGRLCAAIAPPLTAGSDEADRIRSHLRMARQAAAAAIQGQEFTSHYLQRKAIESAEAVEFDRLEREWRRKKLAPTSIKKATDDGQRATRGTT